MNQFILIIPILLPIIMGAILPALRFQSRRCRNIYVEIVTVLNSVFVFLLLLYGPKGTFMAINLAGNLAVTFHIDGLSCVFAGLISALWPFATLYAFEYMEHIGKEDTFFAFYTMTFGVTVGIAFAGNLMTLYMFYEMLTLVTLPLVMAGMSRESILAGRKYIFYAIGGASFAFIGFIFIFTYGSTMDFVNGGVLTGTNIQGKEDLLRLVYVLAVLGFGVKAGIFPFHGWLPTASIAPTPVTALLHAVAVVKAGAFAIIRITYYSYGTDFLRGTWAQYVVMGFAIVTILFGSGRAVKEPHFKRRLAYSTISNLSYVIFGALLMTPLGLIGSLSHMVFHAVIKITLFFCAGAVLCKTNREYVRELDGLAHKMPVVFATFTIGSLALVGIPPFAGFISKWNLCTAAVEEGSFMAYIGIGVVLFSALLTAIYMLTTVIRAYFPDKDFDEQTLVGVKDPTWQMKLPLIVFCIAIITFGVYSVPLVEFFRKIAEGFI
ncbi:MAG: proton-conducting transporter membrane subunit [Lachnospiraceae bacterium]|nr:proton-conducting transporter membrane subunit [Lachnospiraceae bacterium]